MDEVYLSLKKMMEEEGCATGCGGCCTFLTPNKFEMYIVEHRVKREISHYPGRKEFNGIHRKTIVINHPDGGYSRVEAACPFLYAANSDSTPLNQINEVRGTHNVPWLDPNKGIPEIMVTGPKDYQLLCGIHNELRSDRLLKRLFYSCIRWKYLPGRAGYTFCPNQIELYARRIAAAPTP